MEAYLDRKPLKEGSKPQPARKMELPPSYPGNTARGPARPTHLLTWREFVTLASMLAGLLAVHAWFALGGYAAATRLLRLERAPASDLDSSTPNEFDNNEAFHWQSYLLRNPEARLNGSVRTKDSAVAHYVRRGMMLGYRGTQVPILLRYTACQGLFNQVYAHMNALVLAEYLGADVVLPPSMYRQSFGSYFSMTNTKANQAAWSTAPLGLLFDVESMREDFAARGVRLLDTPPLVGAYDCMAPGTAFPVYGQTGISESQVLRLEGIYLQALPIGVVWDRAADLVMAKYSQLLHQAGISDDELTPEDISRVTVVLDLPCPFLSIQTLSCMDTTNAVAANLAFNASLVAMADAVVAGMVAAGVQEFNGAHLRLEKDAVDWAHALGGYPRFLALHAAEFDRVGFTRHQHLYVASGLLSYNASSEMGELLKFLKPHAKQVHYKEQYISRADLAGLNSEQQALVDALVLSRSARFVGISSSTFSVYIREWRKLLGKRADTASLVDAVRVGTNKLFSGTTRFIATTNASSMQ